MSKLLLSTPFGIVISSDGVRQLNRYVPAFRQSLGSLGVKITTARMKAQELNLLVVPLRPINEFLVYEGIKRVLGQESISRIKICSPGLLLHI